jgi:hypothetical protein
VLKNIFDNLELQCDKVHHYFPIYEKWFSKYIGKSPKILEIGIDQGGSSEMWRKYFGEGTQIYGVDISERCKNLETDYLKVTIGDQGDPNFWINNFIEPDIKDFDIIIDDGSHDNSHQITTLKLTYNLLKDGGIYWCEDTHTSYYEGVRVTDGGYLNPNSFTEYAKYLIDVINNKHTFFAIGFGETPNSNHVDDALVEKYLRTGAIHFYDSIVVIEKEFPEVFQCVRSVGGGSGKNISFDRIEISLRK